MLSFGGRPAIMGVGLDITARKLTDARIEALAYHDALTGLPNRRLLQDRIDVAIAQARRRQRHLAVLFLDLDDFKDVNDSLGHHAGDLLLQAVGQRLQGGMRSDDTVARIGGDEFVVLLTHVASASQAALVADKILFLLKAPFQVGERELFVNASVGIATFPQDGSDSGTLLKNADAALYRAKKEGRDNCQPYTLSLHTAAIARLDMESGLRRAQERGELFVEYQPALDLKGGCLHGVEALLRWRHPTAGVLQPAEFLPLAESSSLIVPHGLVGALDRLPAGEGVAGSRLPRPHDGRQHRGAPVPGPGLPRARGGRAGRDRPRPRLPRARDHRVARHAERGDDRAASWRRSARWGCASPSTTSAPGTRRSAT